MSASSWEAKTGQQLMESDIRAHRIVSSEGQTPGGSPGYQPGDEQRVEMVAFRHLTEDLCNPQNCFFCMSV